MSDPHPYKPRAEAPTEIVQPRWVDPYEADEMRDAYDELEAEATSRRLRFDRSFRNRLFVVDDGWVSLTDLDDDFHAMRVALRIDGHGVITRAAGRMLRKPYDTCPRSLESLTALMGANIARPSAHNQIKQRIPRTEGCLHLVDMLTVAFRAFRISKGHDIEPEYGGDQTRRMLLNLLPNMADTCVSFAIEHPERQEEG